MRCLVLGATGYVGTRLVDRLLAEGHQVRCVVRNRGRAQSAGWAGRVELILGDVLDAATLDRACLGVQTLYYLVHALDGPGFADRDRRAATAVAVSARRHGLGRIVYLSGLQPGSGRPVSPHLESRREVGEVFLGSGVPTLVLQAGLVIGSGSAGFEMIRHLTDVLPVLPTPARAESLVQPIGIDDAVRDLVSALDLPARTNRTFDIGGPDVVSYRELSARYARTAGLAPCVSIPVPEAPTDWTARAVEALTPINRHLVGPLLDSMREDMVCAENDLDGLLGPRGRTATLDEALRRAVDQEGAAGARANDPPGSGPTVLRSAHVLECAAPSERVWAVLVGMGGDDGWNTLPGVWALRGRLDGLLGGVGDRRVRPDPLAPGMAWDTWRIETVEPGSTVTLRSEMRLPGTARLDLSVHPLPDGRCTYEQRVSFQPSGLIGRAYWYAQLPAHQLVFGVMASTIGWRAEHG